MPRAVRIGLWSLAGVLGLAVLAVGILLASVDLNSLKPRIAEAVKQATGRDFALNGPIGLGLSLRPTLAVRDVALANPPGYSRPRMATLERLDLKLALLPLLSHRIEIDQLVLVRPDILLETDKQGRANWEFVPANAGPTRAATPTGPAAASAPSGQAEASAPSGAVGASATRISISEARIEDGTLTWRDGVTGDSVVLAVKTFTATAATPDSNTHLASEASYNGAGLTMDGEIGPLTRLQNPADATPWPVRLTLASAGAKLIVDGTLTHPLAGSGYQLKLTGGVPDLAALSSLAHRPLPALKTIAFEGDLHDVKSGSTSGIAFSGVKLSLPSADLAGDATLTLGSPPSLQARLTSSKIDADALLVAFGNPAPAPGAASGAPSRPAVAPAPAKTDRMIPDTAIPFELLRLVDADLTFNGTELRFGGAPYRSIAQHIALRDGKLRLDPFAADLPEGHLSGSVDVDATRTPATVALRLHAPGLAVGPLLARFGLSGTANGNLEVYADVNGAGGTPRGIAADLNGSLGLALANGTVENRLLNSTLGEILRAANLLDLAERGGVSQVQCVAARLELTRGIGTLRTLLLSSTLLTMDGDGTVDLGNETLALRVRPRKEVAATTVVVPLRVSGGWRSPSVLPDPTATVTENIGTVAGAVIGSATPLGLAAGMLGGEKMIGRVFGGGVDCGTSLAIARGQAAPERPSAPSQPEAKPKPNPGNPGDLLRQLFH
jgi:uncharacterized protein involved in outer membrane biogenesis